MGLSQEREIWDVIDRKGYERLLSVCRDRYGEPVAQQRLALQVTDFHRTDLDTRIRITDGTPVLMQKWGDWNDESRGEDALALPKDAAFIARLYRMLGKMLDSDNVQRTVIRLENALFVTEGYEVKLTRHLGKDELFSFEIELLGEGGDVLAVAADLGLQPDTSYKDEAFWKEFNGRANMQATDLAEGELEGMINAALGA